MCGGGYFVCFLQVWYLFALSLTDYNQTNKVNDVSNSSRVLLVDQDILRRVTADAVWIIIWWLFCVFIMAFVFIIFVSLTNLNVIHMYN